jgi:curved DNA-binding protein CbpA
MGVKLMYDNLDSNPYDILEISTAASTAEITKAFGLAMKRRSYSMDSIAKARKILMNPQDRIVADYLRPHLPLVQRLKTMSFSELSKPLPSLEILNTMDDINSYNQEQLKKVAGELASSIFKDINFFEN